MTASVDVVRTWRIDSAALGCQWLQRQYMLDAGAHLACRLIAVASVAAQRVPCLVSAVGTWRHYFGGLACQWLCHVLVATWLSAAGGQFLRHL